MNTKENLHESIQHLTLALKKLQEEHDALHDAECEVCKQEKEFGNAN